MKRVVGIYNVPLCTLRFHILFPPSVKEAGSKGRIFLNKMPSCNNTSFSEKLLHARALVRLGLRRGDLEAIWESPDDKKIFETFLYRCIHEVGVSFQDLLMIHDDELVLVFNTLGLTALDRCVVRRYLNLPEDALWACWTAAQVSLFAAAYAFRLSRAVIGVPGLMLLTIGVGVGLAGRRLRGRILEEAMKVVNRHGGRFHSSPLTLTRMTVVESLSATQAAPPLAQATPRGSSTHTSTTGRTMDRMKSNPFYDPDDMPQKTPRYPVPKFGHYDFRCSSGSPPHSSDACSGEFVDLELPNA